MLVIPAIDIRRGQCVRLYQGKAEQETVYGNDPLEMATYWKKQGATRLHVADLDGAFQGKPVNLKSVIRIKKTLGIPVQMGGGFRDLSSIEEAVHGGIDLVILGTVAVHNPSLVSEAVRLYGAAIGVGIDVDDEFVAVSGWKELSKVRFVDLARRIKDLGVHQLMFTDTRKDGTLSGPNLPAIRQFLAAAGGPVIASGGITSTEDIFSLKQLEPLGLNAVVVGKALYDEKMTLLEALRIG